MDRRRFVAVAVVGVLGMVRAKVGTNAKDRQSDMECIELDGEEVCLGPVPVATEVPRRRPRQARPGN